MKMRMFALLPVIFLTFIGIGVSNSLLGIIAGKLGFWVFSVFLIVLVAAALTLKLIQDRRYC